LLIVCLTGRSKRLDVWLWTSSEYPSCWCSGPA
jgi:hypothetical protein